MAWLLLIFNVYFDFIVAAMLGAFFAYVLAKIILYFHFAKKNIVFNRLLTYGMIAIITLLFCVTYVASTTDPDFSVTQRYRNAFRTIQNWVFPTDPLLARGGMEKAIRMDTQWASGSETIFYTVNNKLYSVSLNGKDRKLCYIARGKIGKAIFSPDGKSLLIKTSLDLVLYDVKNSEPTVIYEINERDLPLGAQITIGGMQWSPDGQKICFFVQKSSSVSTQSQWFVYNHKTELKSKVSLKAKQPFLLWGKDSETLCFNQVVSQSDGGRQKFRIKWFKAPLATLTFELADEFFSDKAYLSKKVLKEKGIDVFYSDPLLSFESSQPFIRSSRIISPSGKSLWINRNLQLCYESAYGVRYILFGLTPLHEYLNFAPKGRENELVLQEIRWLPSEKYALLRHYVHGLLVLQPTSRRIGALVHDQVGIFGFYPY